MSSHCKELCREINEFLLSENKSQISFEEYCEIKKIKSKESMFTLKKAIYNSNLITFTYKKVDGQTITMIMREKTN